MPASKAQQKAVSKYVKANYDLFQIKMPKGKKDDIKDASTISGESLNQYIINAINQRMERATKDPQAAGAVSLSPAVLKAAQEAAEAAGETMPVFITRAIETQAQRDALSRNLSAKAEGGEPNE